MKKYFLLVILVLTWTYQVQSQDFSLRKEVNYIDSVLSKNPYYEKFLGITYYYSLDITEDREIIIKMDFRGPFATTYRAKLQDLIQPFTVDTSEYSSSICWRCKTDETGKETRCILQENVYTSGEKEQVITDDICLMLPDATALRIELIGRIDRLVRKVLE
jgi:hypothetical protein